MRAIQRHGRRALPTVLLLVSLFLVGKLSLPGKTGHSLADGGAASSSTVARAAPAYARAIRRARKLVSQFQASLGAPGLSVAVAVDGDKEHVITIRQLAGHLAGIRNYREWDEVANRTHYRSLLEGIKLFQDDPLLFPPGTRFLYSSYGWNLIGCAIERASGESFLAYMQKHVFAPLGMRGTGPERTDVAIPDRARFYERSAKGKLEPAPTVDYSSKWPSGGLLSTAEDLVRFGSALVRPGFLKPETVTLLFSPQRTTAGEETHYGLGWQIFPSPRRRFVGHTGYTVGGISLLVIEPDTRAVLACVTNVGMVTAAHPTFEGAPPPEPPAIVEPFIAAHERRQPDAQSGPSDL